MDMWQDILPSEAYVGLTYFNDLLIPLSHNQSLNDRKQQLANDATNIMRRINVDENRVDSDGARTALEFIHAMAESERKKEFEILQNYKAKLQKDLPQTDEITDLIKDLNLNNPDPDFYRKLTKAINMIRQQKEYFKARLKRFDQHNNMTMDQLQKDDFRFRLQGDLNSTFSSLSGTATAAQKKAEDSYIGKVRAAVAQMLKRPQVIQNIMSGADLAAFAAVIQISIQDAIQREAYKDPNMTDFVNLPQSTIDSVMEDYIKRIESEDEATTRIQRALQGDAAEIASLIEEGKKFLTFEKIDDPKILQRRAKRIQRSAKRTDAETIRKAIEGDPHYKKILREFLSLDVKVNVSGQEKNIHGILYELIASVLTEGSKVTGSAAIDVVSVECGMQDSDIRKKVNDLRDTISDAYSKYAGRVSAKNKAQNEALVSELHDTIAQAQEALEKDLNVDDPEDIFIYHETLKLYKTMETKGEGEYSVFHGREMSILSAITEIYAASDVPGFVLPDQEAIEMIAYNLAPHALGHEFKNPVQKIFSIFAGLLMFGDIKSIAEDAAKQLQSDMVGPIKNIHLYLLNGVYVPSSLVLESTYRAMSESYSVMEKETAKGTAAKVSISLGAADTPIQNWLKTRPGLTLDVWQEIAEDVIGAIKIKITFMSKFIDFVQSLMNAT